MRELNLCYGCMEPLDEGNVCPHCGYDNETICLLNFLKPGTMLHERYLIGRALESNGEGVTYMAYDTVTDCKVLVREYLPEQLCSRVAGSTLVNVRYDRLAQYKALMAEYTELNKALARLRNLSHLNPALDLVSENNTTYAVHEYLEGRTLLNYLKENAGELSWNTVRRIFPPLFTSLSLLHNAGVLHRGLSPETIFVTDKGELKLRDFCISAVRTNDTELDAQLFDGYAAPEQYFADRQQGTWTDVYGICAVLYRILTGCRATDAISRQDYDNLIAPCNVNPRVPEQVSEAIMKGMALDSNARVRTITDLVTMLFEDTADAPAVPAALSKPIPAVSEESTTVFHTAPAASAPAAVTDEKTKKTDAVPAPHKPAPSPAPKQTHSTGTRSKTQYKEPSAFERIRVPLLIAFLFLAIIGIVVFAFVQYFKNANGKGELSSNTEWSSSGQGNVIAIPTETTTTVKYNSIVPKLVGMNFRIKQQEMAGWLELTPEYVYSEEYYKDQIIWQELAEGAEFMSGSTMKVKVSKGSSKVEMPSFSGENLESYLAKLEELGFVKAVSVTTTSTTRRWGTSTTTTVPTTPVYTAPGGAKQSVVYKSMVNYHYMNGRVCGVSPEPGTIIDLLEGYEIVVYYAKNPVVSTEATTTPAINTPSVTTTPKNEPSGGDQTNPSPPPSASTSPPSNNEET